MDRARIQMHAGSFGSGAGAFYVCCSFRQYQFLPFGLARCLFTRSRRLHLGLELERDLCVDDRDPRVIYGGDWVRQIIVGARSFNETLSAAVATGSTASFNFFGLSPILRSFDFLIYT